MSKRMWEKSPDCPKADDQMVKIKFLDYVGLFFFRNTAASIR